MQAVVKRYDLTFEIFMLNVQKNKMREWIINLFYYLGMVKIL